MALSPRLSSESNNGCYFKKGLKNIKIRESERNKRSQDSAIFLLDLMAPAELRTVTFFFEDKASAQQMYSCETAEEEQQSFEFHLYKDTSITGYPCECL